MARREIKVSKIDTKKDNKNKKSKTILRWPWWLRVRIYKKIATLMLTDEIGFARAQTLSLQKVIDLAVADKLGLSIVSEPESIISDNDITKFMWTPNEDLYLLVDKHVHDEKMAGNRRASINNFTKEAVLEYLEKM